MTNFSGWENYARFHFDREDERMKQKYVYILVLTILTACLALFVACDSTPAIEPPTPYAVSFCVDGETFRTVEISGTQKVIMPTEPAKEGYIFNGWFLDEGEWSQLFTADAYAYKPIEADVTVYAKYTPVKYALTYEPGKDIAHANPTEYTVEQHFELQPATKEHYDFVGWFTDAALTLQTFEIPAGSTGNQTFYAKFEPTQYKAVFMDGETVVAEVPYTIKTKKIIAPEVPEHASYVGEWEEYELTPGGITVNAKYTAVDYKITYEGVKANEHKNPAGYNVTKLPLTLKEATREHYVFAGWYTDAELTTPITEIAADTTGDLTLYAKWTPVEYKAIFMDGESVVAEIPYTVETEGIEAPEVPAHVGYVGEWEAYEFVMGGFTVNAKYTVVDYTIRYEGVQPDEFENPEGYNVTDQPIVLGDAVREHYVFVGWFTDPQCTQRITEIAAGMTGDLVLYAKWTPAEYKAVFMDGETVVGEVTFTILTESIEAPEVPAHVGYTGAWETYELVLGGFTVNAVYTPVDYTITFANTKDAAHVNPSVYNIETETIVLADLYKPGYVFDGWYVGTQRVTEIAQGSTGDVELTAAWTPIVYGITLHFDPLQGKYSGTANPGTFTADDHIVLKGLTSLVPGYTFDGWYTDKNEGYKVTEIAPETIGDIVLYARFVPIEYTITYVGVEDGKNFNPGLYTIETDAFNIAPAFRDGYIFGGWFTDKGCSEPAQLHVPTGSMGNLTLYTKWTPVTYVIEYDADGGVLPDNPAVYDITQAITLKAPTKQGFVFKGWFTAKQDGEQVTEILPGTMGNLKLYAQWEPIYYSITYHLFGGENPQMSMSDLLAGNLTGNLPLYTVEIPAVPLFPATKPGYKFEGWYSDPAYTTRVMMIRTNECKDVVLYAKWSLETYKVTYVLPEGAAHENVSTYTVLDEIKPLNPATKTGYVFDGWYTDDTYTVRVDNLFGAGVYGDLTLYAKFVPSTYHIWLGSDEDNSHAVVFDLNGAGVSFRQNVTPDQGLTYPAIPTREGYVFAGWYDNAECVGEAYDMSAPVVDDITLYAKWIEADAFISINAPMQLTLNGVKEQSFTFVPLVNTVVTFATTGDLDTRGILYDANGNELARNDDASAADKNFKITYSVKAGEAYVITVYGYSQAVQGTSTLSVSGNATVAAGGKAYLPHLYEIASGEMFRLPVPEAREGFKFLGWADEDGKFYTNAMGISLKAWDGTADVVLQEAWEEIA